MEDKNRVGKFTVRVPIYNITVELYIGVESIPTTIPLDTEFEDGSTQIVKRGGESKVVIWMRKMDWTNYDLGLLVHELYHAIIKIYLIIGVEDSLDEEITCYLLQYLTKTFCEKINKKWDFS